MSFTKRFSGNDSLVKIPRKEPSDKFGIKTLPFQIEIHIIKACYQNSQSQQN